MICVCSRIEQNENGTHVRCGEVPFGLTLYPTPRERRGDEYFIVIHVRRGFLPLAPVRGGKPPSLVSKLRSLDTELVFIYVITRLPPAGSGPRTIPQGGRE